MRGVCNCFDGQSGQGSAGWVSQPCVALVPARSLHARRVWLSDSRARSVRRKWTAPSSPPAITVCGSASTMMATASSAWNVAASVAVARCTAGTSHVASASRFCGLRDAAVATDIRQLRLHIRRGDSTEIDPRRLPAHRRRRRPLQRRHGLLWPARPHQRCRRPRRRRERSHHRTAHPPSRHPPASPRSC